MPARGPLVVALALALAAGCTGDPDASPPTGALPVEPLDWKDTGEQPGTTVVVGAEWRAVVTPDGSAAVLSRGGEERRIPAVRGFRTDPVLLSRSHAVVVARHRGERRPPAVAVVDLATGDVGPLPGPRPAAGGSWDLHGDQLRYPTSDPRPGSPRGTYCLAAVDLTSAASEIEHCAGRGEGFSRVRTSDHGTALMTFDDARPVSCRTLVVLTDVRPAPVDGVPDCRGWDVVATGDGAVWSSLPDEQQVQRGEFSATRDGEVVPLGSGATGTLTPCGDSVFFARNAAGDEPARLLRLTPDGRLVVAYEAPSPGEGFLSPPACAADVLTVTLLAEGGDEQVWAPVG